MGKIFTNHIVKSRPKESGQITTELGMYIFNSLNGENVHSTPLEKMIESMKSCEHHLSLYRDTADEFTAFTSFGEVYNVFEGRYNLYQYPQPSHIPNDVIKRFIETELGFNNWDNVAELVNFITLSAQQKDKHGFAFYHWIWEENLLDAEMTYFGQYKDIKNNSVIIKNVLPSMQLGDLDALELLKREMEK